MDQRFVSSKLTLVNNDVLFCWCN